MDKWIDFDYKKIANASQAGVNKAGKNRWGQEKSAEYGASPFIQRYFKDTQGKPPVPYKRGDVERESESQRKARMTAIVRRLYNDAKKRLASIAPPAEARQIEAEAQRIEEEAPKNEIVQLAQPPEGIEVKPKEAEKEKVAEKAHSPTPPKEEEKKKSVLSDWIDEDDIDEWLNEDVNDEFGDSNAGQIRVGLFKYLYSNPKKIQLADAIQYVKDTTDVEKGLSSANVSPQLAKVKELYKEKLDLEIEANEKRLEKLKKEEEEKALRRRPLSDESLRDYARYNNLRGNDKEYSTSIFTSPPPKKWKYLTIYDMKDYEKDGELYFNYIWIDPYTGDSIDNGEYKGQSIYANDYHNTNFGYDRDSKDVKFENKSDYNKFIPVEELDTKEAKEDRANITEEVKNHFESRRLKTDEELLNLLNEYEDWVDDVDVEILTTSSGKKYAKVLAKDNKDRNDYGYYLLDPRSGRTIGNNIQKTDDGYYIEDDWGRLKERVKDLDELKEKPKKEEKKSYKYSLADIPKTQKERLAFARELTKKEKGFNYKPRDNASAGTLRHQIIDRLRKLGLMEAAYATLMAEKDANKKGKGLTDLPEMCGI